MQSHRIISGLTILAMVIVVAAGWFLIGQPQVASAQAAGAQVSAAQAQVEAEQTKVATLQADLGKLPALQSQLAGLQQSIPSDLDAAPFVRQLSDLAAQYGVIVASVQVSDAVYYAPPAGSPAASTSTGSPSPAPSASAAAAPAAVSGWAPEGDPAITAQNFVTIPVNLTVRGDWGKTLAYLGALQTGPRLYLVTKVNANAAADDGTVELSTNGLLFATNDTTATKSMTGYAPKSATPTPSPTAAAPKPAATSAATTSSPAPSASATASGK
jgi:hypothetical protein